MKISELFENAEIPADAVPYKTKNVSGVLTLGPYSNDYDYPDSFKDVDNITRKIDKLFAEKKYTLESIPLRRVLATQFWLDEMGGGDPVFDELDDHPVVASLPDGYYHIVDGHHRMNKAVRMGRPRLKAYVFKL